MAFRADTNTDNVNFGDVWDGVESFSINYIFKLHGASGAGTNRLFEKNITGTPTQGWGVRCNNGASQVLNFGWDEGAGTLLASGDPVTGAITTGTWYQLIVVYDKSKAGGAGNERLRFYLNSTAVIDSSSIGLLGKNITADAVNTTSAFVINKSAVSGNNGSPQDFHLIERTLSVVSAAEAVALYNGGTFKKFSHVGISTQFSKEFVSGQDMVSIVPDVDTLPVGTVTGTGFVDPSEDAPMYVPPAAATPQGNSYARWAATQGQFLDE